MTNEYTPYQLLMLKQSAAKYREIKKKCLSKKQIKPYLQKHLQTLEESKKSLRLYNKKQLQLQQIKEEAYQQEKRRRREQCLSYVAYIPPKDKELYTLDNLLNGLNDALTDNE